MYCLVQRTNSHKVLNTKVLGTDNLVLGTQFILILMFYSFTINEQWVQIYQVLRTNILSS